MNSRRTAAADPCAPTGRPLHARAVGRDAGVRVHLPVQLRDQHERQARLAATCTTFERSQTSRPAVEADPSACCVRTRISSSAIVGCGVKSFGRFSCGISQCCVTGMPSTLVAWFSRLRRPFLEVDRPGERRQQHELREGDVRLLGQRDRRVERVRAIARQPEDERPEHVDAVLPERPQPLDQLVAGQVEPLVDVLEPFRVTDSTPTSAPRMSRLASSRRGTRDPRRPPW